MKRKRIESLAPAVTKKHGLVAAVQSLENILILNLYRDGNYLGRYCMNTETCEFECRTAEGEWKRQRLVTLCGYDAKYYGAYSIERSMEFVSREEQRAAGNMLKCSGSIDKKQILWIINENEDEYYREKRERVKINHMIRVNKVMGSVPEIPSGFRKWITQTVSDGREFAFFDKTEKAWQCTGCEKKYGEKEMHRTDGKDKIRHNDMVYCPSCQKAVQAKKRTHKQEIKTHVILMQQADDRQSVVRHFYLCIRWEAGRKQILLDEEVRLMLFKLSYNPKQVSDIYYKQYVGFDNKSNPGNKRMYSAYLYPEGIRETMKDTVYENWSELFVQMSAAGKKADYNRLMAATEGERFLGIIEYLFKGRFDRLLKETTESVSLYSGRYIGTLNLETSLEGVFGIKDRQKINRIRDMDGGEDVVEWMRWSERTGEKIAQETLEWLRKSEIEAGDVEFITDRMRITQIMNYVKRQQEESYPGKTEKQVLSQWEDYLKMCDRLKKHTADEMVYRPRELKRRHDEASTEITQRQAMLQAEEYRERFPGAEEILAGIRKKYEYENEEYRIIVPERLVDIVAEGRQLHHCVGATDRYFDRIKQRETYICFLRKKKEPELPYYTIEVEPGGTIRQHRGYLDEEPEIERVRPFLKEWQQVIKKRLNEEDRRHAEVSREKREQNIEELKAKKNTRVLEGLMQDFMEAL